MSMGAPLVYEWSGDSFVPIRRFEQAANKRFVIGQKYTLEEVDDAQTNRDRAYHASLRELWKNLPEQYDGEFPTSDDFRRWLMIECGYATKTRTPAFSSREEAQKALPVIMALRREFCQIEIEDCQIVVIFALSQKTESKGGMPLEQRYQSYKDTTDFARSIVGVSEQDLRRNAGQSA